MDINSKNKNQRGSVLVYAFLIMIMIMSTSFAVLGIFLPKIRVASDPFRSVFALYAADSGLEWCLYVSRGKLTPPAIQDILGNGASFLLYYPSSGFTPATCGSSELPLDHRSVGVYQDVSRSLEIY